MYKLITIDNQIKGYYRDELYEFKRLKWWQKEKWHLIYAHVIGYKWRAPLVQTFEQVIKELERDRKLMILDRYKITEFHKVIISNKVI